MSVAQKTQTGARTSSPSLTEHLAALDFAHLWHPFTPMRQWRDTSPTIINRADGFRLFDTDGRAYIDGFSSLWCNLHGHRVPEIDRAITDQLNRVAHSTLLGLANVPSIELAARLAAIAPGDLKTAPDTKVFFSDSGATALEVAFKMAVGHFYHRGDRARNLFICFQGAYHGDTVGAMSVGYSDHFHRPFHTMTFECKRALNPDTAHRDSPSRSHESTWPSLDQARIDRVTAQSLADLEQLLAKHGNRCAAVVLEPRIQGAAGMISQPPGFVRDVADRAHQHGALFIADEVATGFCRTGELFACDFESVTPDILCLAKGISGGYLPLAATVCRAEIAASFEGELQERKTLYHGHTYTGNPLACAAAIASLNLIEQNQVLQNARTLGDLIRRELHTNLIDHPHVGDVRQVSTMIGLEIVRSRAPWTELDTTLNIAAEVCLLARSRGLMIRPLGNVIILNPAPAMDLDTASEMMHILINSIRDFDFRSRLG